LAGQIPATLVADTMGTIVQFCHAGIASILGLAPEDDPDNFSDEELRALYDVLPENIRLGATALIRIGNLADTAARVSSAIAFSSTLAREMGEVQPEEPEPASSGNLAGPNLSPGYL